MLVYLIYGVSSVSLQLIGRTDVILPLIRKGAGVESKICLEQIPPLSPCD